MANKFLKKLVIAGLCLSMLCSGIACGKNESTSVSTSVAEATYVDLAATLKLDMNSATLKQEVTVKSYIDGDTVHFNVPNSLVEGGVLKARFLSVNTPESTGKVEEYGKAASIFTKETLSKATSIIIESDDDKLNVDSTGGRYLVWVWYKTADSSDYRNLNLELLQEGLAIASNSNNNRYGSICMEAISMARACKLNIYSGEKDPLFYYGDSIEMTLRELRLNIADYTGQKVAFEGVVVANYNNAAYVEEYDEETGLYNGIMVYYGFNLSGTGLSVLTIGNRVRVVGTVQYYENGGTYQISGVSYREMKPDDPGNIRTLGSGYEAAYQTLDVETFTKGSVTVSSEEGDKTSMEVAKFIEYSTISLNDLTVKSVYTTTSEDSSSKGAMTLTCVDEDGREVSVRTVVFYDEGGNLITADAYEGKIISVKGIVEYYSGSYQVKVLSPNNITIK